MNNNSDHGAADRQTDRRWLKRQIATWRTLAIVALTVLATIVAVRFVDDGNGPRLGSSPHIARLSVMGVIQTDQKLVDEIARLAAEPNVLGVILKLDSPGGTYAGSEALHSALISLSQSKPTVAVIDGVAASGAYMAAIATNHIVARAGSITGSVGVIMQMPNVKGLMDHIGVGFDAIRSGPLKATPSPFEETNPASRESAQAIVNDLFLQFAAMVSSRRKLAAEQMDVIRTGRIFTGSQALPMGLIDEIGGEETAVRWLKTQPNVPSDVRIQDVEPEADVTPLQQMIERFSGVRFFGSQPMLDGPLAVWQATF
jgi:protease-4